MRVIKYGPGYEPKTHKCIFCHSEFEYETKEIKHEQFYVDLDNKYHLCWDGNNDCFVTSRSVIDCPVCLEKIILEQESNYLKRITLPIDESPKKRKWFSRKEKTNESN
jgi:DNA-directed RNA polymerase subunit RPC12/RpoP